ncbi:MAG: DoxX family protein [Aggregatilineales bacterium]
MTHKVLTEKGIVVSNPPIARFLFDDTRFSVVWLVVRILVGWPWLQAGLTKLGETGWMGDGSALKGFWETVLGMNTGKPLPAYNWYGSFIQSLYNAGAWTWFSKLIVFGELAVGILLILGAFTGIAAFVGAFMSWNYAMAGVASTNMFLFAFAVLLILAWKTAGYYGLDRFLLPRLGTPWKHGTVAVDIYPPTATPIPPSSVRAKG